MLNYLNGVNNSQMNGKLKDKFTTLKNNAIQKLPPVLKKAVNTAGKVASVGVKITIAPMRAAFLVLVRLNALGVAENLEKAIRKDRTKVMNWWKDFGGNFNELLNITNLGIKAGTPGKAQKLTGSLGEPVTVAVATATAVPITTSLIVLLKNIGVEAVKGSADALAKAGKDALTNALNKGQSLPGVKTALVIETPKLESSKPKADKTEDDVPPALTDDTKKSNMPLILGGIAVLGLGAYFLMKKK
jgi:LPXTG-motif cell wall-anchored protein